MQTVKNTLVHSRLPVPLPLSPGSESTDIVSSQEPNAVEEHNMIEESSLPADVLNVDEKVQETNEKHSNTSEFHLQDEEDAIHINPQNGNEKESNDAEVPMV